MDEELIDYAYAYAIDALDLDERREVDKRLAASDSATHAEFDAQVRLTAETMAAMTVVDAVEPPAVAAQQLLASIAEQAAAPNAPPVSLAERRNRRRPWTVLLRRPPQSQSWSAASESGARCPTTRRRRTPPRPKSWQHPTFMPRRVKSRAAVVPRRCSRPPKTPQSS